MRLWMRSIALTVRNHCLPFFPPDAMPFFSFSPFSPFTPRCKANCPVGVEIATRGWSENFLNLYSGPRAPLVLNGFPKSVTIDWNSNCNADTLYKAGILTPCKISTQSPSRKSEELFYSRQS